MDLYSWGLKYDPNSVWERISGQWNYKDVTPASSVLPTGQTCVHSPSKKIPHPAPVAELTVGL